MKIKSILQLLGIVLLSALLGVGYAIYSLNAKVQSREYALQNACWRYNKQMDLQNIHQRALIARIGLFALRETEVLYFVASEDSDGNPLNSDYDYVLEGLDLDTRYWSYTLYGDDFFLVKNEEERFGFNMENIQYDDVQLSPELPKQAKSTYAIQISSKEKSENWLPSGGGKQFHITLRMYNPAPSVYQNLETTVLPTIRKIEQ